MAERYDKYMPSETTGPAVGGFAVTPSDTAVFAQPTRGLYVGTAGDVAVLLLDGTAVTFSAMLAGVIHPLRATQIRATGTTAAGLVGVY